MPACDEEAHHAAHHAERGGGDLTSGADQEVVERWLHPVTLPDMLVALHRSGFSGRAYLARSSDLSAMLEDEHAACLHFLRYGFSETRIFPIELDLGGLQRLHALPVRNRIYLHNLFIALANAWLGEMLQSPAALLAHGAALEVLQTLGAVPLLVVGDRSAVFYRRWIPLGDGWLAPIVIPGLASDLASLLAGPEPALDLLAAVARAGFGLSRIGFLWTFGFADGNSPEPELAKKFVGWLRDAVPKESRSRHHLACLLPPTSPSDGAEAVAERSGLAHAFNIELGRSATQAGFGFVSAFDSLLTPHGTIDAAFLSAEPGPSGLDVHATRGIFSALLRTMLTGQGAAQVTGSMADRFRGLLDEIGRVRAGEPPASP